MEGADNKQRETDEMSGCKHDERPGSVKRESSQSGLLCSEGEAKEAWHGMAQHDAGHLLTELIRDHVPDTCDCSAVSDSASSSDLEYSTADEEIQTASRMRKCCDPVKSVEMASGKTSASTANMDMKAFNRSISCLDLANTEDNVQPQCHVYIDSIFDVDYQSLSSTSSDTFALVDDILLFSPATGKHQQLLQCEICYEEKPIFPRVCCHRPFCDKCLDTYCSYLVSAGSIKFPCPNPHCDKPFCQSEIFTRLDPVSKSRFYKNLTDANRDPLRKTCPQCTEVMSLASDFRISRPRHKKHGFKVTCTRCQYDWCFHCHSPWHANATCKQNRKGDKLLKKWAKQHKDGQVNARRCPKCKIFIQRKSGCDLMKCAKCGVNFCYKCGSRIHGIWFLGGHHSKFSIFGCKSLLFPDRPLLRNVVRGIIFGAEVVVAPILGVLALVGAVIVLVGALVASPVIVGIIVRRKRNKRRDRKEQAEMRQHDNEIREMIHRTGDPYLDKYSHLQQIGVANVWHLHRVSHIPAAGLDESSLV